MAEISLGRGLIVVCCFIGSFVFLVSLVPGQFLEAEEYSGRTITPPEYFEAIDLQFFSETWNTTIDNNGMEGPYGEIGWGWFKDNDIGGHDLGLYYDHANVTPQLMKIKHYWSAWIIRPYAHNMEWVNPQGVSRGLLISSDELDEDYTQGTFHYTVSCSHFQMKVFFGFNETLYSSPQEAWDHYDLGFLQAIQFDQEATGYNAWDLIAMLIFYQLPDVHWVINVLAKLPFWVTVAYIASMLILEFIKALPFT